MTHAPILYYFPTGGSPMDLSPLPLEAIPEALRPKFHRNSRVSNTPGPDNLRGLLITWCTDVLVQYLPAIQTWRRIGDYWCGLRNDYTAAEFARTDCHGRLPAGGYSVTLGDGRDYIIPVALLSAPNFELPYQDTLDEDGRPVRRLDPKFATICQAASQLWDHVSTEATFEMDDEALRLACANALAVNYNLDLTDCLALGLFTTESYRSIVEAILDIPALDAMIKKKAPVASSTASGVTDDSTVTSPPGPTTPS